MALFIRSLLLVLVFMVMGGVAHALSEQDTGVFVALDQEGQPVEKILRVSKKGDAWKFEDRQPDGSWLDVSCHGGCEHRHSTVEDLTEFFGSGPPPSVKPECIHNAQYAFCHFMSTSPEDAREGYVLVVRAGEGWLPVTLTRLPDGENKPAAQPKLESAGLF